MLIFDMRVVMPTCLLRALIDAARARESAEVITTLIFIRLRQFTAFIAFAFIASILMLLLPAPCRHFVFFYWSISDATFSPYALLLSFSPCRHADAFMLLPCLMPLSPITVAIIRFHAIF